MVLGALAVGGGLAVVAQEATPDALTSPMTTAPIVGAWQWNADPASPEPSNFAIFHADGTYTEWQPVGGQAIGLWRMTGERTYELLFVFPDTDPSLEGFRPGTATFRIMIELDETGNAFTAVGTIDVRDAGGTPVISVPWTRPATRMTFEMNPATGSIPATPMAATPTP